MRLKSTTKLVKSLLETSEKCRNSDNYLYYCIIKTLSYKNNIPIEEIKVTDFFLNMDISKVFPPFETVRRARQKIQEHHPELAATAEVRGHRADAEAEYVEYARHAV
jgi:hypothetical protein